MTFDRFSSEKDACALACQELDEKIDTNLVSVQ